jgi:hypothetical protein
MAHGHTPMHDPCTWEVRACPTRDTTSMSCYARDIQVAHDVQLIAALLHVSRNFDAQAGQPRQNLSVTP